MGPKTSILAPSDLQLRSSRTTEEEDVITSRGDSPHWIARGALNAALLARRSSPGALLLACNAQAEADYLGVAM